MCFTFLICSCNLGSDQDSVRLLAVEGCAALGKLLEPQDCVAHILPVIVNFSQVHDRNKLTNYICVCVCVNDRATECLNIKTDKHKIVKTLPQVSILTQPFPK